ncbi:hypothetical protein F66182_4997 [Fusarium sp. NRRL 66182]|nr:hypothetical protein F66182_4997 [Fusarium sp. NRRL 66182]
MGAPPSPSSSQISNNWPTTTTTASTPVPAEKMKLSKRAGALASMSLELRLRSVSSLANRLERDVQRLVLRTAEDQDFRRKNEERMTKIIHEVEAIKAYMAPINVKQLATQADIERLKQELSETNFHWKRLLEEARAKIDDISGRLSQVSEPVVVKSKDSVPICGTPPTPRRETRAMRRARVQLSSSVQKQQSSPSSSSPESRINNAINSTKRWNREHKVTKMRDSQFIAGYLKKQGQRDPGLAKLLQRAIQKRIPRGGKAKSGKAKSPQKLEELCCNVSWQGVIDTATDIFVVNRTQTLRALARS